MIPRTLFSEEHNIFREAARRFMAEQVVPYHEQWEIDGKLSREAWLQAGEAGMLCTNIPEQYGGMGGDFLYSAIVLEEQAATGCTGPGFNLHSDIVAPYLLHYGSEETKQHWLPKMATGEVIAGIGMTEPSGGSDLAALKTTAIRDGDHYVINGQKVFITNGQLLDFVLLAVKTTPEAGSRGISQIIVEADRAGFKKGRNLKKIGFKAQDTSELFFDNVRVPVTNLVGEEGRGFSLTEGLATLGVFDGPLQHGFHGNRPANRLDQSFLGEFLHHLLETAPLLANQVSPYLCRPLPGNAPARHARFSGCSDGQDACDRPAMPSGG